MNYYRLSFCKVTTPDPKRPLARHWQWYELVCVAQNKEEAKDHGRCVADDRGVKFVDAIRLLRVVGAALIDRDPPFREIIGEAAKTPLAIVTNT